MMKKYMSRVKTFINKLEYFYIMWVLRRKNKRDSQLTQQASFVLWGALRRGISVELFDQPSTSQKVVHCVQKSSGNCMILVMAYLAYGTLFANKKITRKTRLKASQYAIVNGIIFSQSYLQPLLQCVGLV